jgi:hypothetical protein
MNFIKKWIGRMAAEGLAKSQQIEEARVNTNKLHDMFQSNMAAMVAFKIDNGYVVRTMDPNEIYHGARVPGFVYCADHQAIADHLVASAMKQKLGVQPDMFTEEAEQNQYSAKSLYHNIAKSRI